MLLLSCVLAPREWYRTAVMGCNPTPLRTDGAGDTAMLLKLNSRHHPSSWILNVSVRFLSFSPSPSPIVTAPQARNTKYGLVDVNIKQNEPSFREEKGFRSASTKSLRGIFWRGESNGKLGWYALSCRCKGWIVHLEHSQNMFTIRSRLSAPLLIHAHTTIRRISES